MTVETIIVLAKLDNGQIHQVLLDENSQEGVWQIVTNGPTVKLISDDLSPGLELAKGKENQNDKRTN